MKTIELFEITRANPRCHASVFKVVADWSGQSAEELAFRSSLIYRHAYEMELAVYRRRLPQAWYHRLARAGVNLPHAHRPYKATMGRNLRAWDSGDAQYERAANLRKASGMAINIIARVGTRVPERVPEMTAKEALQAVQGQGKYRFLKEVSY